MVMEFLSLKSFFQSHGIEYHRTCVYTPQQNGVVESIVIYLLLLVHCFFNLTYHLLLGWMCFNYAYLINRRPSPLLSNKSPFELLYKHPPSFDHLRVFGCLCYVTLSST